MSDNKPYYYIKLKDNYFDSDNIKILEAQENGYIYSLIILKLYLKSAKYDGRLMMTDRIPYDPNKLDVLARVLNHDVAHIKDALQHGLELDLISIQSGGEIWMTEIQNFIGQSSTEADRKREYRKKLDFGQMSGLISDKTPPELKKELKKNLEINTAVPATSQPKKKFKPPTFQEVADYCKEKGYSTDPEHFISYYDARGWKFKTGQPVVSWKACLTTWNKRNSAGPSVSAKPTSGIGRDEIDEIMGGGK